MSKRILPEVPAIPEQYIDSCQKCRYPVCIKHAGRSGWGCGHYLSEDRYIIDDWEVNPNNLSHKEWPAIPDWCPLEKIVETGGKQ